MKRKSYVTCLMFNLVERSAHFALHSTGHQEEGVGDRKTLQNLLLWVCFIGGWSRSWAEHWGVERWSDMARWRQNQAWKHISGSLGQWCSHYSDWINSHCFCMAEMRRGGDYRERDWLMEQDRQWFSLTILFLWNIIARDFKHSSKLFCPMLPREILTKFISFSFQRLKNCIYPGDAYNVTVSMLM